MTLSPGTRLGPYEIVAPLGAGGMGEVYRANDSRLNRIVAVKVLPAHLSTNPDLKQRFEREARAISSITHPNICALYDIGNQEGIDYLVMEYLEGETLAQRLARGALPTEQVLRFGIQIADALDKAHKQGIIHRDLKPGNIMITKSGAKLLDFGLAKFEAGAIAPALSGISVMATQGAQDLTAEGTLLGTFQYMSPEQLEGKDTDARTDIFSLGVVLYEMATARRAFTGKSAASLISAILSSEPPPISTTQPLCPPSLDRVVKVCLAKDPDDRWQTAHDVTLELKWIAEGSSQAGVPVAITTRRKTRERISWALAGLFFVLFMAALIPQWKRTNPKPLLLSILSPPNTTFESSVISPDGQTLAFVAADPTGRAQIWVRPVDSLEARPLPQTENAEDIFWSPDSKFVAFFWQTELRKISIAGGQPIKICSIEPDASEAHGFGSGAAWSQEGVILFAKNGVLFKVPASGGKPSPVTKLSPLDEDHDWPCFLADGRHFVFLADSNQTEDHELRIGSLDGQQNTLLTSFISNVVCSDKYIFYVRAGTLMAHRYEGDHLVGDANPIADSVLGGDSNHRFDFSSSTNGVVVYRKASPFTEIAWVDRNGEVLSKFVDPDRYVHVDLSPDNKHAVAEAVDADERNGELWLIDLIRNTKSRFTFDPAWDMWPYWSPDGTRIAFGSTRGRRIGPDVYLKNSGGTGADQLLLGSEAAKIITGWSPDGKFLLILQERPQTSTDIWVLPLNGGKPFPYIEDALNQYDAKLSPNSKWVAYGSDESGTSQVYVQSFPAASGTKYQISTSGGWCPQWRADGKELYFMGANHKVYSVDIKTEPAFDAGVPKPLFSLHGKSKGDRYEYAPSVDGQRFLVTELVESGVDAVHMLMNWPDQ